MEGNISTKKSDTHGNDSSLNNSSSTSHHPSFIPLLSEPTNRIHSKLFDRVFRLLRRSKSSEIKPKLVPMSSAEDVTSHPLPLVRANAYSPQDASTAPVGNVDVTDLPEYFAFVWGSNSVGQLLVAPSKLPQTTAVSVPQRIDRLAHRCITYLYCGAQSTWLVSDGGDVWAGGKNSKGQILPSATEEQEICQARFLEDFETMRVKSVASADEHTVLILETGVAVSFGTNEFGQLGHGKGTETLGCVNPRPMLGLKVPASQACCGTSHTLILAATGQVFSCGNSADGCLGLGDSSLEATSILHPIPSLLGVPIQEIAAGPEHSMALSLSGCIFSWGRNRKGRLGLGSDSPSVVHTPSCVNFHDLEGIVFKHIATGQTHSAAIGPKGQLFLCGDNSDGQLGRHPETIDHLDTFQPLDLAMRIRLTAVGDRHTIVATVKGEVFCFGRNTEGQLGHSTENHPVIWNPSPIGFYDQTTHQDFRDELYFYAVAAGREHTAAIAILRPRSPQTSDSTPIRFSDPTTTPDTTSPTFQSQLSRLGSRTTLLRSGILPYPKVDLSPFDSSPLTRFGSTSIFHLPPILSNSPARPSLHTFQSMRSMDLDRDMVYPKKTRHMLRAPLVNGVFQSDDVEAHLPAGCSVDEILSLIELVQGPSDHTCQIRFLRRRLTNAFSDPHRLNCSFLLPGRLALLDVDGVEEIFDEIDKLPKDDRELLYSGLYHSASDLLSAIEPHAAHFIYADQMRCIALLVQLRFLSDPTAANLRLLGKLSSIVFCFPETGRRSLVDLFKTQYSANPFGQRLVAHVRAFLNVTIKSQSGKSLTAWHGVVLFQLMFLSSMEWGIEQRNRAIEIAGRTQIMGKVPPEDFILESISDDIDIAEELRSFRKYGASLETSQLTSGPRVNVLNIERCPLPGGIRFQTATFTDSTPPVHHATVTLPTSPTGGTPGDYGTSGEKKINEAKRKCQFSTATSLITGRPRAIFDPVDALTVTKLEENWTFFLAHQNICPLKFKRNIIIVEALVNQQRSSMHSMFMQGHPFFFMSVRRNNVVEDALNIVLCSTPEDMLKPLEVIFDGEEGVDAGGLKREFFDIIVKTLFNPQFGMFLYNDQPRTIWFNRNTIDTDNEFFLVGVILGLALYNDNLLNLRFPNVVWKKLQNQATNIEDLVDVFPDEGDSFIKILDWPAETMDEFNHSFNSMAFEVQYDFFGEIRNIELKPNGKNEMLTYDCRKEYVDLYVDYLLNSSIHEQFEAFKKGFLHFQTTLLETLSAEELRLLVCGTTTYDFNELREGVLYEGFRDDDPYIQGFWDILNELDIHQQKKFLRFCTGTDRVPLGGLKELALKVQRNGCEPTGRLPTAYTCFNLLLLPEYSSKTKLQRLLILAIEQSQGFGLM